MASARLFIRYLMEGILLASMVVYLAKAQTEPRKFKGALISRSIGEAKSVISTVDDKIVVASALGIPENNLHTPNATLVMMLSPRLDSLWARTYSEGDVRTVHEILQAGDGNFLLLSESHYPNDRDVRTLLAKIDGSGTLLWEKRIGSRDGGTYGRVFTALKDGGALIAGMQYYPKKGDVPPINRSNLYIGDRSKGG